MRRRAYQVLQRAVVTRIEGLEPASGHFEAVAIGKDVTRNRVLVEHPAALIEDDRADGQAAHRAGVHPAQGLLPAQLIVQLQCTAQMRQQGLATRAVALAERGRGLRARDPQRQTPRPCDRDIHRHDVKDIVRPARLLKVGRAPPVRARHQVIDDVDPVRRQVRERRKVVTGGLEARAPAFGSVADPDDQPRVFKRCLAQDQGQEIRGEQASHFLQCIHPFLVIHCGCINDAHDAIVMRDVHVRRTKDRGRIVRAHAITSISSLQSSPTFMEGLFPSPRCSSSSIRTIRPSSPFTTSHPSQHPTIVRSRQLAARNFNRGS